ncbi:Unknown protein, partial [Striga hermonthica]
MRAGASGKPSEYAGSVRAPSNAYACSVLAVQPLRCRSRAHRRSAAHVRIHPRTPHRSTHLAACSAMLVRTPAAYHARWPATTHASTPTSVPAMLSGPRRCPVARPSTQSTQHA